ncbi:MAG: preprotein translocase SecA subunit [Actinomycetota bacterium]
MSILDRILRAGEGKKLKALEGLVPDINALESSMRSLSDDALRAKTAEFRQRLERGESLDELLVEAFAVVREGAGRVIGQRHFDVQMMGGAALHFGWVAEMKTGEGKTLVSTLPAYLNGLTGRGVHVITVNDYLARFHAEWMGRIHNFLGLEVGLVVPGANDRPAEKRRNYAADITYGTNNEFGFDYLRDNMAGTLAEKVQRGHYFAIVDEVDSILIDEARTPLIISGRVADAAKLYYRFASIVRALRRDVDYEVEEDKRVVVPLEAGIEKVEQALDIENLYDEVQQNLVHQLSVALKAKELYKRDKDYIVQNGEVKIVDEFTGRVLEGRRWSEGIHQAVEAKEGVKIKEENQTLATITLQNYFRMYDKLAGMTGTAQTEAAELGNTYELQVVPIPTNRQVIRVDQADLIYKSEVGKYAAVVEDIVERHEKGQPVLVGTISVEKSEYLSRQLSKRGVVHEVLNAKQHTREATIVAQAGRLGAVTVATNMAGRGVDILLGGNPEGMARRDVLKEGHDPDVMVDEFTLPVPLDEMPEEFRTARTAAMARYAELLAQHKVQCAEEGDRVRDLGGLYVLGTERHDSRRIDNQLRGRSGRQGDPGESRFYLSLDDELMRLFATGALSWVMGRALPDDEAIEAKMVTKAIERAQTTVEQRNAEIRKNVLKYDEVMNEQRKVIYARRDQILEGADLKVAAMDYLSDAVDALIDVHCVSEAADEWDLEGLVKELRTFWPNEISVEQLSELDDADDIFDLVMADAKAFYERRETELTPVVMRDVERQVMLRIIDQRWREHLEEMDYLQEGINLRAMGQKDPLTEWQREGFEMFGSLMKGIAQDFVKYVMHVQVVRKDAPAPAVQNIQQTSSENAPTLRPQPLPGQVPSAPSQAAAPAPTKQQTVVNDAWAKTPRNAPCPCGSGKKFKQCHGATTA